MKVPIPKVPRSWRKERVDPTHFVYVGATTTGAPEVPKFGCGWRTVALETLGRKWATVVETGTGARAKMSLELWGALLKKGRVL